jgi:hypothetical protein
VTEAARGRRRLTRLRVAGRQRAKAQHLPTASGASDALQRADPAWDAPAADRQGQGGQAVVGPGGAGRGSPLSPSRNPRARPRLKRAPRYGCGGSAARLPTGCETGDDNKTSERKTEATDEGIR